MNLSLRGLALMSIAVPLTFAAVGVGYAFGPELWDYVASARQSQQRDFGISKRGLVYRLSASEPTRFALSKPVEEFRMLTSPALAPDVDLGVHGVRYGVQVRLLAADGSEIRSERIFARSIPIDDIDEEGYLPRFFRNRNEEVGVQDETVFQSAIPVASVELTSLPSDAEVTGVDARVYERRPFLSTGALAAFLRRSPEEQRAMARADAFPIAMMSDDEKANLAANLWRPVGPVGIEGRDYTVLVMYEAEAPDEDEELSGGGS